MKYYIIILLISRPYADLPKENTFLVSPNREFSSIKECKDAISIYGDFYGDFKIQSKYCMEVMKGVE